MKKVAQIIGLVVIAVGILVAVALLLKKYFAKKENKEEEDCGIDDLDEFEPDDEDCDGDCDACEEPCDEAESKDDAE